MHILSDDPANGESEYTGGAPDDRASGSISPFRIGSVYSTPAALELIGPLEMFLGLKRHLTGDWGEVCPEDWAANDRALTNGSRLLSSYTTTAGHRFWIITEADRSVTTLLLPDDY
jgi:hypothetical protein